MAEAPRPFDLSGLLAGICELTPTVTYHTTGGFPEEIFVDLSKEEIEDKTVTENIMATNRFFFLKSYNIYQRKLAKWI